MDWFILWYVCIMLSAMHTYGWRRMLVFMRSARRWRWVKVVALCVAVCYTNYPLPTHAQSLLVLPDHLFTQGLVHFQQKQYACAQQYFEACMYADSPAMHIDTREARYYAALCALHLGLADGEAQLRRFIQAYPCHRETIIAYYHLGNYHFVRQGFSASIPYYLQVDSSVLDKEARYAWQYRLAYAYLNEKNFAQALLHFNTIKVHHHAYAHVASYYAGYLGFKQGDYTAALEDLLRAGENPAYQGVVPYLALQIYYQQKRFQELLAYIHHVKSTEVVLKEETEIVLLIAEAYFGLKNYVAAAQHYEEYVALKDFVVPHDITYRMAYACYKAKEIHKALKYFKTLVLREDRIGQLANYYAGVICLATHQKMLALEAFDRARRTCFSPDMQEVSIFHYAKLNYELGHFSLVIEALQHFQRDYERSQYLPEVKVLLSEAYFRVKAYDLAIKHLEDSNTQSPRTREIYQKVTFCRGSEYFNHGDYHKAISFFQKSLSVPIHEALALQARLWLSESFSALKQYELAIPVYQYVLTKILPADAMYGQATYGLGYAYYNMHHYEEALPQFLHYTRQYSSEAPDAWLQDARVRLADCYYATKQYQQALQTYEQAISYQPAYIHYQKGLIHGMLGDQAAVRENFQVIFNDHTHTPYYEQALFKIAHMCLIKNDYAQAITAFTRLIHEKPKSLLLPDALLSRATAYVNLQQYDSAVRDYEHLLKRYPTHVHAKSALLELSSIYALEGEPEKISQYLTDYQGTYADATVVEALLFDTARSLFYEQRYEIAIQQLEHFIARYPTSQRVLEATFLVAEAYYRQDHVNAAAAHYQKVLEDPTSPFLQKALSRMGLLTYKQQDFLQSLQYYQQLEANAKTKKEQHQSLIGLMKVNHALQRYEAVQQHASMILKHHASVANVTNEATLFLGKAAMQQGNMEAAKKYFAQVAAGARDKYAVEAHYCLAQWYYAEGDYLQSLETLFAFNKRLTTPQSAWKNKSFLLIADNYLALQEYHQAKATLRSIIENAEDTAISAIAQEKLASLAKKEEHSRK